jgi:hypothetical protein
MAEIFGYTVLVNDLAVGFSFGNDEARVALARGRVSLGDGVELEVGEQSSQARIQGSVAIAVPPRVPHEQHDGPNRVRADLSA